MISRVDVVILVEQNVAAVLVRLVVHVFVVEVVVVVVVVVVSR